MARTLGSKNKDSLNLTALWRGLYTEDDINLAYQKTIAMLNSSDPKDVQWAVDFIAKRFTIAQDKLVDAIAEQDVLNTKEEYDRLLRTLLANKETPEVQDGE